MNGKVQKKMVLKVFMSLLAMPAAFLLSTPAIKIVSGTDKLTPSNRQEVLSTNADLAKNNFAVLPTKLTQTTVLRPEQDKIAMDVKTTAVDEKKTACSDEKLISLQYDSFAKTLLNLTNEARTAKNLNPLCFNLRLMEAATNKAADMARIGYFAHQSPSKKNFQNFIDDSSYKYSLAGENLAVNFLHPEAAQQAWLDSPTHAKNIFNSDYTEIGIGIVEGKYKDHQTVFYAVMFGAPKQ
jgi:uncharacterized protein YkwD